MKKLAILGLGLMGGSLGIAVRRLGLAASVHGYARRAANRRQALRLGAVDKAWATPEDAVRDAWTEIVGAPIAHMCHPLRIDRERTLVVGVSNPVVRQELLFHKAGVLKRIQAIPACSHITDVSFRSG